MNFIYLPNPEEIHNDAVEWKKPATRVYTEVGRTWLTPVIPATQEAEIRRIEVPSQPGQIVFETLSQKYPTQKRSGGVPQAVEPSKHKALSSNPSAAKKKKKKV
jgi:hypothetical protein